MLLLQSFIILTVCGERNDWPQFQATLLNFYNQQLVAHGTQFFAATAGLFTFINGFMKSSSSKEASSRKRIAFIFMTGILFSLDIYIVSRLVLYGFLASATIGFGNIDKIFFPSLGNYSDYVVNKYAFQQKAVSPILINYLSYFVSNFNAGNFNVQSLLLLDSGLTISLSMGFMVAYLVYWAFGEYVPRFKLWTVVFVSSGTVSFVKALWVPRGGACSWIMLLLFVLYAFAVVYFAYGSHAMNRTKRVSPRSYIV